MIYLFKIIDSILWATATILMVYCGIYLTFKLKFVQFNIKEMLKNLLKKEDNNITSFESLMMVLGGRIGVGSIAGIALAIYLGGIGSIFWMWIIGFISAANSFAETTLGVKYQEKNNNHYIGGPSYYIKKGLNNNKLSNIYALIIVISQIFGFLSIQANTITNSLNLNPIISGLIITFISYLIISKNTKQLFKISAKLVPIMTIIYIIASIYIIIININSIPYLLINIIKEAFNFKALGFGVVSSFIVGIQRGIFSNEAGLGTGSIAASTVKSNFPASQGYVQMLGIYITTFLVCTATALVILTSDIYFLGNNINGIEITQNAFIYHLGNLGNIIVIISIILFAFSTILSGYYDAESNTSIKPKYLRIIICFDLFISSIISANIIWEMVNIITAILAIINIYALLKLKKDVIFELRRYKECGKMK